MGPNAGAFICVLVFALGIGTLIGSVILRAAISLYNSLAGGPDTDAAVPEPSFGEAMGIVFATYLVNFVVGFLISLTLGEEVLGGERAQLKAQLITLPVGILVMTLMLSAMLPTTFFRALLVAICQVIISVLIVFTIVAVVLAVGLAA